MEIEVRDIPSDGLELSYAVASKEWGLPDKGITLLSPIQIDLKAYKHGDGEVYLLGELSTRVQAECVRCLKTVSCPVHSDFHLEYAPLSGDYLGKEEMLSAETIDLNFYEGTYIDIDDEMKGQFFLSVPHNPLCQPECRGLCPRCGTDLNTNACQCRPEPVDPRWAILGHFKYKENDAKPKT